MSTRLLYWANNPDGKEKRLRQRGEKPLFAFARQAISSMRMCSEEFYEPASISGFKLGAFALCCLGEGFDHL